MDKLTRLSGEERGNLIAYLDGELDESTARVIEQKLARSDTARHDVEMLVRTWDLLDLLERPRVTQEFTTRTLALAQAELQPSRLSQIDWQRPARRVGVIALWLAVVGGVAAVGWTATRKWVPNEAQMLLDDLPVIESLDLYTEVDSIEFLRELRRSGSFHEKDAAEEPAKPSTENSSTEK
jgi:hypothetical protein